MAAADIGTAAAMAARIKAFVQSAAARGAMPPKVAASIVAVMDGGDSAAKARLFDKFIGVLSAQRCVGRQQLPPHHAAHPRPSPTPQCCSP